MHHGGMHGGHVWLRGCMAGGMHGMEACMVGRACIVGGVHGRGHV